METEQLSNLSKVTHSCAVPFLPFVQGWQPQESRGGERWLLGVPVPIFHASFESLHLRQWGWG